MKALIVGCGRVGSALARKLNDEGWAVSVVDETEEALSRLGEAWPGEFHVGHGMDTAVLERAGIEDADTVIVATDGDNTNIVVAQVAKKCYGVESVGVRILDPARADFYSDRGLHVVSPTRDAIESRGGGAWRGGEGGCWGAS
jgi:trk system potassium uptake protein TrkA